MFRLLIFILTSLVLNAQTINVYTYDSFVRNEKFNAYLKKFEKKERVKINFTIVNSKFIANRIALEGKLTKADLAIGIDDTSIEHAYKSDTFDKHNLNIKYKSEIKFPDIYKETFIAYDYAPISIIYDSNITGDLPPMTLHDFLEAKGKVVYPNPQRDTLGANFLKLLYVNGDFEENLKLLKNKGIIVSAWWEGYSKFLRGEVPYVMSYQTSPLYHMIEEGKTNFKAIEFTDGTVEQLEFMAIPKYAKNRELAEKLIKYILSEEGMSTLIQAEYMLSTIDMDLKLNKNYKVKKIKILDCSKCKSNQYLEETWIKEIMK